MPAIRHDSTLLRLLKDVSDIRAALRRVTVNLPLFDVASENTPAQLTSSQNNYVIGNYDILRLASNGPHVITGMRGGIKGRRLQVFNVGSYTLAFAHQNTASDAANRFKFNTGLPAFVEAGQNITFYYDFTQQRWIEATNVFEYDIGAVWDTQTVPVGFWTDITWSEELGLLVAVASSGAYVMTSPDGINWTTQTPANTLLWEGIAWSPELSLFVATARSGAGNRVMTSPDGVVWTARASAANNEWYSIAWSPGLSLFAAIARGAVANQVMTSPNGLAWSPQTATNSLWIDIVWADSLGLFVAISEASSASNIITSPDGVNWSLQSKTSTESLNSIAWSPELGLLVAVGTNAIYSSADGTTWNRRSTLTAASRAVAWSPELNMFLVVGLSSTNINLWSGDGINWSSGSGIGVNNSDMVWANGLGLFVSIANNAAYTTP